MTQDKDPNLIKSANQIASTIEPSIALARAVLKGMTNESESISQTPSVSENLVGGIVGDWVAEWRTRRLLGFMTETSRVASRLGIDPESLQNLPDGMRYKILDAATQTEDPLLGKMWVNLMFSALQDDEETDRFIQTLSSLTGKDAKVLTFIHAVSPLGQNLQDRLNILHQNEMDGYKGKTRSRWHMGTKKEAELPTKSEYKKTLLANQKGIKTASEDIRLLYKDLLGDNEISEARDALLRAGLIQRRKISFPDVDDIRLSQRVLVSHDYKSGYNDWEDVETCDPDAVATALDELHNLLAEHTGYVRNDVDKLAVVQYKNRLNVCPYILTPFGESLYEACAMTNDQNSINS